MQLSNSITTLCGQQFTIDLFEQLAVGVIQSDKFLKDPTYIPNTFAVYHTCNGLYLLELTRFRQSDQSLKTVYKILSEAQATKYLNNCMLDLS
jgi:hypothetical protein